jgi:hypothetical protein
VRYLATILITLLLAVPAMSVELFRYRGAAKDGGTLEYVFEAGEQNSPHAVTKEKAAEIAADFMTTFYHVSGPAATDWTSDCSTIALGLEAGRAFVYTDRESGRVTTILGYPTAKIAQLG